MYPLNCIEKFSNERFYEIFNLFEHVRKYHKAEYAGTLRNMEFNLFLNSKVEKQLNSFTKISQQMIQYFE